jgi:GTP-binding protein
MIIRSAKFVKSSEHVEQCPMDGLPDFAFVGRSNVGKSSLINMLAGNSQLSKVSATPGKTRLINHFIINDEWYLVDLPGYGYAKAGKGDRRRFANIIENYLKQREMLTLLFLLIDSRLAPQKNDLDFVQILGEEGIPFEIIFTKTDKISRSAVQKTIQQWQNALYETWEELPNMLLTSSEKRTGREEVLEHVAINISL